MNISDEIDGVRRSLLSEVFDAEAGDFDHDAAAAIATAVDMLLVALLMGFVTVDDLRAIRTAEGPVEKVRMLAALAEQVGSRSQ